MAVVEADVNQFRRKPGFGSIASQKRNRTTYELNGPVLDVGVSNIAYGNARRILKMNSEVKKH